MAAVSTLLSVPSSLSMLPGESRDDFMSAASLWQAIQIGVQAAVSPASYQTWLAPLQAHQWDADTATLTLATDSRFKKDWVGKHYQAALVGALQTAVANTSATVQLVAVEPQAAQPSLFPATDKAPLSDAHTAFLQQAQPVYQPVHPELRSLAYDAQTLNPKYRWETLVVSNHNRFAVSAGQAVAAQPGQQFNPLCLHGGTGLGKTHVLQAMAHQLQAAGRMVCYVTAEQFTNELIAAVAKKQWQPFRNRYRQVDVLLIDDVQFLGGKERTQQEFFHTLNTLVEAGKQVVLSSDRPPAELDMLDERLRSRFEMGLLVEVTAPDEATRTAILNAKAQQAGLALETGVADFLAQRFSQHVRQLEGALNTLQAMTTLAGTVPNLAAVQAQFGGVPLPVAAAPCQLGAILATVGQYYDITVEQLCGQQRSKQVALARQVAMYLMRALTSASHAEIGRAIGGRQHSTVVHAVQKVTEAIQSGDELLAQQVNALTARLKHECLL